MREAKSILIGAMLIVLFATLAQMPLKNQIFPTGLNPRKIEATVASTIQTDKRAVSLGLGFIGGVGLLFICHAVGRAIKL